MFGRWHIPKLLSTPVRFKTEPFALKSVSSLKLLVPGNPSSSPWSVTLGVPLSLAVLTLPELGRCWFSSCSSLLGSHPHFPTAPWPRVWSALRATLTLPPHAHSTSQSDLALDQPQFCPFPPVVTMRGPCWISYSHQDSSQTSRAHGPAQLWVCGKPKRAVWPQFSFLIVLWPLLPCPGII